MGPRSLRPNRRFRVNSGLFELGSAAQNAAVAESPAKFPLIVISHGTGGSALSIAWIDEELAAHGQIAAAVNHPGNNGTEAYTVEGFSTCWERARDLSVVIDKMLADSKFGAASTRTEQELRAFLSADTL